MKIIRDLLDFLSQFIPLLLTFVLAASSYWYAMQNELELFQMKGPNDPAATDHYLRNFAVQNHDLTQGRYAIVHSQSAEHTPKNDEWRITKPKVQQYDTQGGLLQAQAKQGRYAASQDTITLEHQVTLHNRKNGIQTTLETQELTLDNPNTMITTHQAVEVTRPGQRFEANGLEFNTRTGQIKATGHVRFNMEAPR
jgi:LPS export ABC transporter protein LptC